MPTNPLQTIGFTIDLSKGSHLNTEYKNEKLQLKEIGTTNSGKTTYATHGEWVSDVVNIKDEYLSLENLAIGSIASTNGSTFKAYTRTSKNGTLWGDYVLVDEPSGKMNSNKNLFAQIKIEFKGKTEKVEFIAETFNKNTSVKNYVENEYVKIDGELRLKRTYNYKMTRDSSWSSDGYLLRKKIKRADLKKIDSLVIQ